MGWFNVYIYLSLFSFCAPGTYRLLRRLTGFEAGLGAGGFSLARKAETERKMKSRYSSFFPVCLLKRNPSCSCVLTSYINDKNLLE